MYNLPYHEETNQQVIHEFIEKYPFAFLTGCDANQQPVATQVPLFLEQVNNQMVLRGHFMKNTDHHLAFAQNPNVLAVFTGKHTYVSATWYSNPNIPSTWNYMSVHARGKIKYLPESDLVEILRKTTLHFENDDKDSPTVYDNLDEAYRSRLLKMIVGFEIKIEKMEAVFKLSQDRDQESYMNIIQQLKLQDADGQAIADEMEKRAAHLFDKH